MRTVAFSFEAMTEFFSSELDDMCSDYSSAYKQCKNNSVITNENTCMGLTLYNYFAMAQSQWAYGWLSYDSVANNMAYKYCSETNSSFKISFTEFVAALQFNFGYQSCDGKLY